MTTLTFERLALLEKCSEALISTFLHRVIDSIQHGAPSPAYEGIFSETWDLDEWWQVVHVFQRFSKAAVERNWDVDQIFGYLEDLSNGIRQEVIGAICTRRADIIKAVQYNTCAISNASLNDFDWQVKLAIASDKLATVKTPIVSVDFDIKEDIGKKKVSIELNHDDLKKIINSLEAANKVLSQLRS